MARVYMINQQMKVMYSIENSVGKGCANRRDDVYLVQFFLRTAMEPLPETGVGYIPPGQTPIKIDGVYGSQTQTYIDFYVSEVNRLNKQTVMTPDGRLDPVSPNSNGFTTPGGKLYKLYILNLAYFKRRGLQKHLDLSSDPQYPAALNPSLYV